jgi:thiosulfate dehydrogenase (quinone) large subunit
MLPIVVLAGAWTLFHLVWLEVLTGIATGFGVLMNLNYLLAVSINPVLAMLRLFLCFSWRVCDWIGFDRWLLPALGLPRKPGTWYRSQEPCAALPPS